MAAVAIPGTSAEQCERSFFLALAVFVSAVIASGFLIRIVNGTTAYLGGVGALLVMGLLVGPISRIRAFVTLAEQLAR